MYSVRGQELATPGEEELDVQLGTDIVCQKFTIADIVKDRILGFEFCKTHQAEWKWADDELHLDVQKSGEKQAYEIDKSSQNYHYACCYFASKE